MSVAGRLAAFLDRVPSPSPAVRSPGWRREVAIVGTAPGDALPPGYAAAALPAEDELLADLALVRGRGAVSPLLVLDIETTSEAGVPFLVGVARYDAGALAVEQWLLDRPDAERSMLADLAAHLDAALAHDGAAWLSFGGAAFDAPLLSRRMARLRIRCDALADRRAHVDLLPVARRLWRRVLPDCRLATLEARVLGLVRRGDPGGAEVARIGSRWLTTPRDRGSVAELARVQRHNRADLVSLPPLCRVLAQRLGEGGTPDEALGAAAHRLALGDRPGAIDILRALVHAAVHEPAGSEAALRLAALARRDGRHDEAAALWAWVLRRRPGDPRASLGLAKHLEHRVRDPAAALRVAASSRDPCPRRLARLGARLSAAGEV